MTLKSEVADRGEEKGERRLADDLLDSLVSLQLILALVMFSCSQAKQQTEAEEEEEEGEGEDLCEAR